MERVAGNSADIADRKVECSAIEIASDLSVHARIFDVEPQRAPDVELVARAHTIGGACAHGVETEELVALFLPLDSGDIVTPVIRAEIRVHVKLLQKILLDSLGEGNLSVPGKKMPHITGPHEIEPVKAPTPLSAYQIIFSRSITRRHNPFSYQPHHAFFIFMHNDLLPALPAATA